MGLDYDPIDESTAKSERRRAEVRLRDAETGAERTAEVVAGFRDIVGEVRAMHTENHFVQRLRPIFQGTH